MRNTVVVFLLSLSASCTAMAADFSPVRLTISAPEMVSYDFGGSELTIPVNISGANAGLVFCVFTRDAAETIQGVQNGHLGWHYVNRIDTCVYASTPYSFKWGENTVTWNGRTNDGSPVPSNTYTYYMWAYDNTGTKTKVCSWIRPDYNGVEILERDPDGLPLTRPVLYNALAQWKIGSDPYNESALQTTAIPLKDGWQPVMKSCIDPFDIYNFYVQVENVSTYDASLAKFSWVPGGNSILETDFGDGGYSESFGIWPGDEPGVVTDGEYLYTGDSSFEVEADSDASFIIYDFDGWMVSEINLSDWWSSSEDYQAGGQMNGGPSSFAERNGKILLNCHCSCIKQMVDPIRYLDGSDSDFYVWTNGNGDYILDKNFEEINLTPWVCNDTQASPYPYSLDADDNLFSVAPANGSGTSSFGLLAPDGTGLGYFAFAGETSGAKLGSLFVDSDTAYDGLYCDNNSADMASSLSYGTWYIGHDSIGGVIVHADAVEDEQPKQFALSQNIPNPFNPVTTIPFTLGAESHVSLTVYDVAGRKVDTLVEGVLSAGAHEATWEASEFSSGVYFYRLKGLNFEETGKMTLVK